MKSYGKKISGGKVVSTNVVRVPDPVRSEDAFRLRERRRSGNEVGDVKEEVKKASKKGSKGVSKEEGAKTSVKRKRRSKAK